MYFGHHWGCKTEKFLHAHFRRNRHVSCLVPAIQVSYVASLEIRFVEEAVDRQMMMMSNAGAD